jgi:Domain of unknown function (DUF4209)
MALVDYVVSWLNEDEDSADPVELYIVSSRILIRLKERQANQAQIDEIFRALAPLEFQVQHAEKNPWDCHFAPKFVAGTDNDEYPNLAMLTAANVDEWAELAEKLTQPLIRARFADAVWELGKRLGSRRKDLYRFGLLASEMYLDSAEKCKHPWELLNFATRAIQLGMKLGDKAIAEGGFEFMMKYADSVELSHYGLWSAPFDRLLGMSALSDAQRQLILKQYEERFNETVATGDIMRIILSGPVLANYFYKRKKYQRAKDITFAWGEAVLKAATMLNSSLAAHHIGNVLESYRSVGLKEEVDRVRLLMEERAKGIVATLKTHRFELKLDLKSVDEWLTTLIDVSDPFVALYRLADNCAPNPEKVEARFESMSAGMMFHRLIPTSIIGGNGLTVKTIGTYDQDKEGRLMMAFAQDMNLNATFFLEGFNKWKKKFELGSVPATPEFFDCPLIPSDRVSLYREGLLAFENEDYVKCIHVLVFQVENSLRELLKMLGLPVSKSTEDGYELKNMNDVLHDSTVRETLEPKLWSFLKLLYIDKRGMNLRNIVAHGLETGETFNYVNAALVIQSVIFLSVIRDTSIFLINPEISPEQESSSERQEASSVKAS